MGRALRSAKGWTALFREPRFRTGENSMCPCQPGWQAQWGETPVDAEAGVVGAPWDLEGYLTEAPAGAECAESGDKSSVYSCADNFIVKYYLVWKLYATVPTKSVLQELKTLFFHLTVSLEPLDTLDGFQLLIHGDIQI